LAIFALNYSLVDRRLKASFVDHQCGSCQACNLPRGELQVMGLGSRLSQIHHGGVAA
jgi:hypothetical protein